MNPTVSSAALAEDTGGSSWPWALLAFAVCLVAISSQSLWIDEAFMAGKASQPTLAGWWHMMPRGGGSDLQMPLYMIYMWAFAKIFGIGEWALRAANIPWFVAGVAAFVPVFPKPQRLAVGAVTVLCPFAWFYLNEARPYAMQFGASLVIFAALYRLSQGAILEPRFQRNWVAIFLLGVIVLCGSSLLGVLWAGAAFLTLFLLFSRERLMELLRTSWLAWLFSIILLAALGGYYLWTIKRGTHELQPESAGGSAAVTAVKSAAHFRQGFAGGTDLQNVAFVIYELLGFSGLGPGRLEIRTGGLSAFRHFAPQLALYALTICCVLCGGISCVMRRPGLVKKTAIAFIALTPMLLLMLAGYFLGFRILGRHCTPLMAVILYLLAFGVCSAWPGKHIVAKIAVIVFIAMSLLSCLSLRFAARHEKDDYRDAARVAETALGHGQKVWWSASDDGAAYYRVPLVGAPGGEGRALLVLNPTPKLLASLPAPDIVITSKPDLYDNQQAIAQYVRNNPYVQTATFPAFSVWQRKSPQTPQ